MSKIKQIKPITPEECIHKIPECIIEAFNSQIKKNFDGKKSFVKQRDILEILIPKYFKHSSEIFDKNLFDIEDIYKNAGWDVEYNKQGIGDEFNTFFSFIKKEKNDKILINNILNTIDCEKLKGNNCVCIHISKPDNKYIEILKNKGYKCIYNNSNLEIRW